MSVSMETYYGGAESHQPLSGNITLDPATKKLLTLDPDAAGRTVTLRDATELDKGHGHILINVDAIESVAIKDNGGTTISTLAAGEGMEIGLCDNSDADGKWFIWQGPLGV